LQDGATEPARARDYQLEAVSFARANLHAAA
jgi:hypothetical protein